MWQAKEAAMTASIVPLHGDETAQATGAAPSPAPILAPSPARARLLDVAEELWGRRGMEGASLREIAAAAGQRNNSAVRYHFRDKAGLVEALLADRMGRVEAIRAERIAAHKPLERQSPETLLRLMWQPMLDLAPQGSPHALIRFMLAFLIGSTGYNHPLVARLEEHPASDSILRALHGCLPHLSREQFEYRMGLVVMMFWAAVSQHDQAVAAANLLWSSRFSLDETIKLSVAALAAPV